MRVINFDRRSKRRLRQIRWTLRERTSVALLFLLLVALCILYEPWDAHYSHFSSGIRWRPCRRISSEYPSTNTLGIRNAYALRKANALGDYIAFQNDFGKPASRKTPGSLAAGITAP
jgi:hypothetical protein